MKSWTLVGLVLILALGAYILRDDSWLSIAVFIAGIVVSVRWAQRRSRA